jgi:acyl-CoA thioester hydrolase
MATQTIETFRGVAYPWFCDSMGHMNTQFYASMYDSASFHFLSRLHPYGELERRQRGWADVRQVIEYKHEVRAGTLLLMRSRLMRLGGKSVTYLHELRNAETDELHGTSEQVTVMFDLAARKAIALDERVHAAAKQMGWEG